MNTCPNCGKVAGLHSSILQGCMCQYSVQAMKEGKDFTISKPWVGLTEGEFRAIGQRFENDNGHVEAWMSFARHIQFVLKEKNGG